jgi:peptide-methionine (S)-S-oxide reductase
MVLNSEPTGGAQVATLAGGCFWCLEAIYDQLQGVLSVESGYAGGHTARPTYQEVGAGHTGHAEAVQIVFDPVQVSYRELLQVFFSIHDPTTLNRQGADVGSQYRSAVFYHDQGQMLTAVEVIREVTAAGIWQDPIVTELAPFQAFHKAEPYHQEYYVRNGGQAYCQVVIAPKVVKSRKQHLDRLKR